MLLVLSRSYIHLMSEYSLYLNPLTVLISGPSVRSEHICAFLIVDFAPGMICWYLCSTVSWDIFVLPWRPSPHGWCHRLSSRLSMALQCLGWGTVEVDKWPAPVEKHVLLLLSKLILSQMFSQASQQHNVLSWKNVIHHILGRISNYPLSIKPSISAYKQLVMQNSLHLKLENLFGELFHFHIFTKFSFYKNTISSLKKKYKNLWLNPLGLQGKWCIFRSD